MGVIINGNLQRAIGKSRGGRHRGTVFIGYGLTKNDIPKPLKTAIEGYEEARHTVLHEIHKEEQ